MAQPFLGELRIFSFNFAPRGWAMCNGQLMSIQQNAALFAILGTTYGGDGQTTFGLPNLQNRVPLHFDGNAFQLGQTGGETAHTLITAEMPVHNHVPQAKAAAATHTRQAQGPGTGQVLAEAQTFLGGSNFENAEIYGTSPATLTFAGAAIGNTGGGQAHPNQQPYLVVTMCIALVGIFPSRN